MLVCGGKWQCLPIGWSFVLPAGSVYGGAWSHFTYATCHWTLITKVNLELPLARQKIGFIGTGNDSIINKESRVQWADDQIRFGTVWVRGRHGNLDGRSAAPTWAVLHRLDNLVPPERPASRQHRNGQVTPSLPALLSHLSSKGGVADDCPLDQYLLTSSIMNFMLFWHETPTGEQYKVYTYECARYTV